MLLPRFTIRWILGLTLVCALLLLILRASIAGSAWATGVSAAIGFVIVTLLVHGLCFGLLWLASQIFFRPQDARRQTPGTTGSRSEEVPP
ncbi:MAG: hypothetical protein VB875_13285 [Pirellulales bacterium]